MNRSLQILLGIAVGVAAFVIFLLANFPLDAVVNHTMAGVEAQTKGRYRLSYSHMDPSLLFDSVFENFKLEQKNGDSYDEIFFAKNIKIGISLFSLLSRSLDATFAADLKRGRLSGRTVLTGESSVLDLEFEKVALDSFGILKTLANTKNFSLAVRGVIDGTAYFALGPSIDKTDADFRLKISDFRVQDVHIPALQNSGFSPPDLILAPKESFALFEGSLEAGRLTLTNVNLPGSDIELQIKGRMNLERNGGFSRANLRGRFALSDALFEKIPPLAILKDYKTADGFFPLTVSGASQRPQIRIGAFNVGDMLSLIPH